ncbi:TetR family transcriptional regulator, partial [Klebsiella pneumoniae]|uniref:TetR family transcriptional regulator n=1 Tax=Klebsiella pneumoniae TaxID=573 RepID=UPI0034D15350
MLEVALRLFVEKGPDVPFTEIAKEAGVGVGTGYPHSAQRAVGAGVRLQTDLARSRNEASVGVTARIAEGRRGRRPAAEGLVVGADRVRCGDFLPVLPRHPPCRPVGHLRLRARVDG